MKSRFYKILLFIPLLAPFNLWAQNAKDSYSSSSVLASGKWFKIAVLQDGIYKISYSKLKQLGLTDPSNPKIYANNFGQLSYYNDDPKPDDLREIKIYTNTGDVLSRDDDYLLFYGQAPGRWKFNESSGEYDYVRHNYSDTAFYFLTSGGSPGKRIVPGPDLNGVPAYSSNESDALFIHEIEMENLLKSGREWYELISSLSPINVDPGFSDIVMNEKMNFRIRVLARASVPTLFRLFEVGWEERQREMVQPVNMYDYTGTFAQITDSTGSFYPKSSSPVFSISFINNGETGAKGWVDFITLQGRKNNSFYGNTSFYSDSKVVGPGHFSTFSFTGADYNPMIWDLSDPSDIKRMTYSKAGSNLSFNDSTNTLKKYVLFTVSNSLNPIIEATPINNQNLHGSDPADMIIVSHPLFLQFARKLADIHLAASGLITQIVTPEQIYNEFSGGIPDICAIRNFIRMKYLKQSGTRHPLKYLLLFGDGSYENKTQPPKNPNFIPTYQSQNSNIVVSSFTSDDFYGLLDDGEGEADGTEDIGIGRLPVSDTIQAGIMVRKIARYMDASNMGNWKNIICLTADDEDGNDTYDMMRKALHRFLTTAVS